MGFDVYPTGVETIWSDDPYVFAPFASDSLPTTSISRLPITGSCPASSCQAQCGAPFDQFVDKVQSYEAEPPDAPWKLRALHLVEDRDLDGNLGFEARTKADSLLTTYAGKEETWYGLSTLYGTQLAPQTYNVPAIQTWNAGLGFVFGYGTAGSAFSYGGGKSLESIWDPMISGSTLHGYCRGPAGVSCSGGNCVLTGDSLTATGRYGVVFSTLCGTAFHSIAEGSDEEWDLCSRPRCLSLAQHLLFVPSKGACAVIGPTRAIFEAPAYAVAKAWFQEAFDLEGPPSVEPGRVLLEAKRAAIVALPGQAAQVLSFSLLGDGALRFATGSTVPVGLNLNDTSHLNRIEFNRIVVEAAAVTIETSCPGPAQYICEVFDVAGRRLGGQRGTVEAGGSKLSLSIPVSALKAGILFVQVHGNGLVASRKIAVVQ